MIDPSEQINDTTLAKYKLAGKIATITLNAILTEMNSNPDIKYLCDFGDHFMTTELNKSPEKYKGISLPTFISKNNIAGHFNFQNVKINNNDLIKIELGTHVDGYPAILGFTTVFKKTDKNPKRDSTLKAAILSSRDILNIMKPGKKSSDLINILNNHAKELNCSLLKSPVENENYIFPGVMSFQMSKCVIDGHNGDDDEYPHQVILHRQNNIYDYDMRDFEFEENDVYGIDVAFSSGLGKLDFGELDNMVYRRNYNKFVSLKLKSSREMLGEMKEFPRKITMDNRRKLGLKECLEKEIVTGYPCAYEKEGEFISRIRFTVIVKEDPILVAGKSGEEELKKME